MHLSAMHARARFRPCAGEPERCISLRCTHACRFRSHACETERCVSLRERCISQRRTRPCPTGRRAGEREGRACRADRQPRWPKGWVSCGYRTSSCRSGVHVSPRWERHSVRGNRRTETSSSSRAKPLPRSSGRSYLRCSSRSPSSAEPRLPRGPTRCRRPRLGSSNVEDTPARTPIRLPRAKPGRQPKGGHLTGPPTLQNPSEPPSRIELETYGLRNRCSTPELGWPEARGARKIRAHAAASRRHVTRRRRIAFRRPPGGWPPGGSWP
jgi:hypothetical protein